MESPGAGMLRILSLRKPLGREMEMPRHAVETKTHAFRNLRESFTEEEYKKFELDRGAFCPLETEKPPENRRFDQCLER